MLCLALIALVTGACGASSSETAIAIPTYKANNGEVRAFSLTGTLTAQSAECLTLTRPSEPPVALVWPSGYSALRMEDGVVQVNGKGDSLKVGDAVTLAGGFATPGTPASCGDLGAFEIDQVINVNRG